MSSDGSRHGLRILACNFASRTSAGSLTDPTGDAGAESRQKLVAPHPTGRPVGKGSFRGSLGRDGDRTAPMQHSCQRSNVSDLKKHGERVSDQNTRKPHGKTVQKRITTTVAKPSKTRGGFLAGERAKAPQTFGQRCAHGARQAIGIWGDGKSRNWRAAPCEARHLASAVQTC